MRPRAKAHIVVQLPVFQIMSALERRRREIGDLILFIAITFQHLSGIGIHIRLLIVIGKERGSAVILIHWRPLFQLQRIA